MELTFIVEHLALLHLGEISDFLEEVERAYLVENCTRIVKVGIDSSLKIFTVSLDPHQYDYYKTVFLSSQPLDTVWLCFGEHR